MDGKGQAEPGNITQQFRAFGRDRDGSGKAFLLTSSNKQPFEYQTPDFLDAWTTNMGFIFAR
jgi:hypothetical protein